MFKIFFSHGRTALLHGLASYNFSENDIILIPDYICEIVELTLKKANLKYIKYNINDDFTLNYFSLSKIYKKNKNRIKAIIIVNYFGFPQKIQLLKKIFKKKILIIEDNSHGFSGIVGNNTLGTRGDLGFSSPRKVLKIFSGGVLYTKYKIKPKLNQYSVSAKDLIIFFLNKFLLIKLFLKKIYFFFEGNSFYLKNKEDNKIYNNYIDDFSKKLLTKVNLEKEKKIRFDNYIIWKKFLKNKNINIIFKNPNQKLMIWCLPFYAKNSKEALNWLKWGKKKGITIFSWPDLSKENFVKKNICFKRWQKLVCLPLDIPNEVLKKICN